MKYKSINRSALSASKASSGQRFADAVRELYKERPEQQIMSYSCRVAKGKEGSGKAYAN